MKKTKIRIFVALLLVLVLSSSLLAGCAAKSEDEVKTTTMPTTTTATVETTTSAPTQTEGVTLLPEYNPTKAFDEDGNEMSLTELYGTAYTTYGGSLKFNEDKTFSLTVGIDKGDGVGTYKLISSEEIELNYTNGKKATAKITEVIDGVATEISVPRGEFTVIFN